MLIVCYDLALLISINIVCFVSVCLYYFFMSSNAVAVYLVILQQHNAADMRDSCKHTRVLLCFLGAD